MLTKIKWFQNRSFLYNFLYMVFLATFLVGVVIYLFQEVYVKTEIQERNYAENNMVAVNARIFLDEKINHYNDSIEILASNIVEDKTHASNLIETFVNENMSVYRVEVLDISKAVTNVYPTSELIIGMDRSLESYFDDLEGDSVYWTKPYLPHLSNKLSSTVIYMKDDVYVVCYVQLDFFSEMHEEITPSLYYKDLIITDEVGVYLLHEDSSLVTSRLLLPKFNVISQQPEDTFVVDISNVKSIMSVQSSTLTGWYVFVVEDYSQAFKTLDIMNSMFYILLSVVMISIVLVQTSIYFMFSKNIRILLNHVDTIQKNEEYSDMELDSYSEFNVLRKSVNEMYSTITESNRKLQQMAYEDTLTNLYSLNYLQKMFDESGSGEFLAIFLNVEQFSLINKSFGFTVGNKLLKEVSNRLMQFTDESSFAIKIEAVQFCLFMIDASLLQDKDDFINMILSELKKDYVMGETTLNLDFSCAIVSNRFEDCGFDTFMSICRVTIGKARNDSNSEYTYYKEEYLIEFERQLRIENAIAEAFEHNEFTPYFQAIMDVSTNEVFGFEALSRLESKKYGLILPNQFIPLLVAAKRMFSLEKIIMRKALAQINETSKRFGKDFRLGVNISMDSLLSKELVPYVKSLLDENNMKPERLFIELIEENYITDDAVIKSNLEGLIQMGVNVGIDDFGDGYSSLSYLSRLDVSYIKISHFFVKDILVDKTKTRLIKMIIALAKELNLNVVMEGIESKDVFDYVKQWDIQFAQGFYFQRPISHQQLNLLLEKNKK